MKRFGIVAALMAGAGLAALVLLAAAPPAAAQLDRPCAEEMAKYCSGITPGGGRMLACYEREKKNLSPACVAWAERLKQNAQVLREACSADIEQKCNFEKGDPMEMLDCLQGNYLTLAPKCMNTLNQFKYHYPKPVQ